MPGDLRRPLACASFSQFPTLDDEDLPACGLRQFLHCCIRQPGPRLPLFCHTYKYQDKLLAMASATPPGDDPQSYTTMSVGDVEAIGAHCQMAFCHQLDFLPFKCESCKG